jgi:hypothetical protein
VIPASVQAAFVMAFDDDTAVTYFAAPTAVPIAIVMTLDYDGFCLRGGDLWQSETHQRKPRRENYQGTHFRASSSVFGALFARVELNAVIANPFHVPTGYRSWRYQAKRALAAVGRRHTKLHPENSSAP